MDVPASSLGYLLPDMQNAASIRQTYIPQPMLSKEQTFGTLPYTSNEIRRSLGTTMPDMSRTASVIQTYIPQPMQCREQAFGTLPYTSNVEEMRVLGATMPDMLSTASMPQTYVPQPMPSRMQAIGTLPYTNNVKEMRVLGETMPDMPSTASVPQTSVPQPMRREQATGSFPYKSNVKEMPSEKPYLIASYTGRIEQEFSSASTSKGGLSFSQDNGMDWSSETKSGTFLCLPSSSSLVDTSSQMVAENTFGNPNDSKKKKRNAAGTSKKPVSGQKKPVDEHASVHHQPRKKKKAFQVSTDQSIESLRDVVTSGAVDLKEEEELLKNWDKVDSRIAGVSDKAGEGVKARIALNKIPLRRKLAEKMAKFGLKNISSDLESCLSLCVEQRLCDLISSSIRMSKQRSDSKRTNHSTEVTSAVRDQVLTISREDREEWKRKEAESQKLCTEENVERKEMAGVQQRRAVINAAARAAVGGTDVTSKWKLMARARQEPREGPTNSSTSRPGKSTNHKTSVTTPNVQGVARHSDKCNAPAPPVVPRTISTRDVISALEREPQMARSTLIYRLYERPHTDA